MKNFLLALLTISFCFSTKAQEVVASDSLYQTHYFSFHTNMWMNLHHFFYERASQQQKQHLHEDNVEFMDMGDREEISKLSKEETAIFNEGVEFYKENVVDQKLINSGKLFKWLQKQPAGNNITDTTYSRDFTQILNKVRPLYEAHFWPNHREENIKLLKQNIHLIEKTERTVIKKMELLSGSKWNDIVRIDLTTYGNWASAYSPEVDNIVISSIDPLMHSTLFIEFVFHESSHLLFLRNSPFRRTLFAKAKELEIKYPRQLWHAAMFYLSGIATSEMLQENGISHELIMQKKHVFARYYTNEKFKSILMKYYHQEIEMEEMALELLKLGQN